MGTGRRVTMWGCLTVGSLLLASCGGGDDDELTLGAKNEPIDCGELTCSEEEFCLYRRSSPLGVASEATFECAQLPAGCGGSDFCDCEATEGEWDGTSITGCSALGTRELTVTDDSCGASPCAPGEGCVAFGSEFMNQERAAENYCYPMPDGCEAALGFCDTDCAERLAVAAGESFQGCIGSSNISAVLVESTE